MEQRIKELMEENARLAGDIVFLTKQVSDRDGTIQELEELASLGIHLREEKEEV